MESSIKLREVRMPTHLPVEATKVLSLLKQPNYLFLTLEELSAEGDLDSEKLSHTLGHLKQQGLVTSVRRGENILWGLTYKGYNSAI